MVHFGPYAFDERSGDLRRGSDVTRLTPQTAALLALLLSRNGEVVSRAEIRERIWPDTTVEFDQGLNFCIRQLRIALEDDASHPTYIETLPRRGYRFLVPRTLPATSPESHPPTGGLAERPAETPGRRLPLGIVVGAVALVALVAALRMAPSHDGVATPAEKTLAIVPFDIDGDRGSDARGAREDSIALRPYRDELAEVMVERVARTGGSRIGVIGPSSVKGFGARTLVDTIRARTGAAYALSGVVRRSGSGVDVFAQLIRASDRVHLWATRWRDTSSAWRNSSAALGATLADSVRTVLLDPVDRRPLRREK